MIAFFLSGISLVICASINNTFAVKQLGAIGLGVAVFVALHFALRNGVDDAVAYARGLRRRRTVGGQLVLAETVNGALNWITVGPVSVQPSEFVKVAFVFVGAATLEKLRSTQSLTKYVIFAVVCVGALFFMRDFGTALIFSLPLCSSRLCGPGISAPSS
jgi:cell division protein FtsW (lipid II flippase)